MKMLLSAREHVSHQLHDPNIREAKHGGEIESTTQFFADDDLSISLTLGAHVGFYLDEAP